jgi:hypothetical protein
MLPGKTIAPRRAKPGITLPAEEGRKDAISEGS